MFFFISINLTLIQGTFPRFLPIRDAKGSFAKVIYFRNGCVRYVLRNVFIKVVAGILQGFNPESFSHSNLHAEA
jgi:hypothetical protein